MWPVPHNGFMSATFELLPLDPITAGELRAQPNPLLYTADTMPGYPCRQCLRDAEVGDELILVSHDPFTTDSPYRTCSPIFLHRHDCAATLDADVIPMQILRRQLSVRAFDDQEMMVDAAVIDGADAATTLVRFFGSAEVDHVDIHNATRGCWAARAVRTVRGHDAG